MGSPARLRWLGGSSTLRDGGISLQGVARASLHHDIAPPRSDPRFSMRTICNSFRPFRMAVFSLFRGLDHGRRGMGVRSCRIDLAWRRAVMTNEAAMTALLEEVSLG
jgi:hypothetical protein